MDNKPTLVRILTETIGISTCVAIILGVPAMIAFIISIWLALSPNNQIIAVASGSILLFTLILFVYSRARKKLYVVPSLLADMHTRVVEIASQLSAMDMSLEDIGSLMSLVNIDPNIISMFPDIDALQAGIPNIMGIAQQKSEETKTDKDALWRIQYFLFEKTGLKKALLADSKYIRMKKQLDKFTIPNVEIRQAILDCEKTSYVTGTFLPLLSVPATGNAISNILPPSLKMDGLVKTDGLNDQMKILFSKVNEAIDRYYKGKS